MNSGIIRYRKLSGLIFSNGFVRFMSSAEPDRTYNSSLYVSSRYGQEMSRILEPSFDVKYLDFLSKNITGIKELFRIRQIPDDHYCYEQIASDLKDFIKCIQSTETIRKTRKKLLQKIKKNSNEELSKKYDQLYQELVPQRELLHRLEDKLIPFLLAIPNEMAKGITDEFQVLDQSGSSTGSRNESHSYVRLGYVNNSFQASIVGPNAKYLQGQGAQLYHGLINMASELLDQSDFIPVNGLDLVKSAIIEAVNSRSFSDDNFMLKLSSGQSEENQRLHLVGDSSLESICALAARLRWNRGKFYQLGSSYESDCIEQKHQVRATIFTAAESSEQEMENLYRIWWNFLEKIGLKRLSVRSDIKSLAINEFDKYLLLVWLRSSGEWTPIGQISHHHSYINQRLGLPDYRDTHLITSSVDLIKLICTILEHFQKFETGNVEIPPEITKYFM